MPTFAEPGRWRIKGPEMEGPVARWYARLRGTPNQIAVCRRQAAELTRRLPDGSAVLEVAPGPGYLAIEMARSGRLDVTGLDISRTFVELATANAHDAGVAVDFRHGDVAAMPFASDSFDLVVCQAAFKNFTRPATALAEIYRVLRSGGSAVIQDMSRDATHEDITHEVEGMNVSPLAAFTTRATLEMLKRRAYSRAQFERLAAESPFGRCVITTSGIGLQVDLKKEKPERAVA